MLLVFILCFIVIIIQILIIGICFSNTIFDIKECDISYNEDNKNKIIINKLNIDMDIYIFKKIRILKIRIYKNYYKVFYIKFIEKIKEDNINKILFIFKNVSRFEPKIKEMNLDLNISTENMMLTIISIPLISTIIFTIISAYKDEKTRASLFDLNVEPKYINTNTFLLKLSTKISFDTIAILYFMRKLRKMKI